MPPGLYGLCDFGSYAGLIDDAAAHAAEEGVLMTGGSLTAAAAGLMLCFCDNPVFCLAAFRFREPGFRLLYRFFSAAPDVLTASVLLRRPR